MEKLEGKNILLICAKFFGYELEIQSKIRELGARVDWFDQRPSNSFFAKALIRINNKFLFWSVRNYYLRIIDTTKDTQYDYILFISPEVISKNLFIRLMDKQSKAKSILYMWDSFKNKSKKVIEVAQCFDYRFSFDKEDCEKCDFKIHYRPLFYLDNYSQVTADGKKDYDLLFIGTIHSDRYEVLQKIRTSCELQHLSVYFYMYFPSKILYYAGRFLNSSLRKTKSTDFRFDSLGKAEIVSLFQRSRAIVDIQHPKQIGLTMRTIEVLGARRKLITTNPNIVNYDFYNPQNIHVIDRNEVKVNAAFFDSGYSEVDEGTRKRYSIEGWIEDIFFLRKEMDQIKQDGLGQTSSKSNIIGQINLKS